MGGCGACRSCRYPAYTGRVARMAASRKRNRWIIVFLLITALAIAGELYAAFDSSPDTTPWTDLLTTYVSPWITFSAIAVLVIWLPWHFVIYYRAKRAERAALKAGIPRIIAPEPIDGEPRP